MVREPIGTCFKHTDVDMASDGDISESGGEAQEIEEVSANVTLYIDITDRINPGGRVDPSSRSVGECVTAPRDHLHVGPTPLRH